MTRPLQLPSSWRDAAPGFWRRLLPCARTLLVGAVLVLPPVAPMSGAASIDELQLRGVRGDAEALNALGTIYAEGQGVPRDDRMALLFFQQAADRGNGAAWFNIGMFHELGRGVPTDVNAAFRFYLKAAERGFPPAQFNVGNMYANGIGVKQDPIEAVSWFKKAAEQGVSEAQFNLGLSYELGRGVRQDEGLARRWYRRAVAQGNVRAQYNLAVMLDQGRGAPADTPDSEGALVLYRSAAEQNFGPAQNNLGLMLAEGRGTSVNLVEAYTWLALAVQNGVDSGALNLVANRMSPEALQNAQGLLADVQTRAGTTSTVAVASAPAPAAPSTPVASVASEGPVEDREAATAAAVQQARRTLAERAAARSAASSGSGTTSESDVDQSVPTQRPDSPSVASAGRVASSTASSPSAGQPVAQDVAASPPSVPNATAELLAELERVRAENVRLAEVAKSAEASRADLLRRLAAAESVIAPRSATPASERWTSALSETDVNQLRAISTSDPLVEKLFNEHALLVNLNKDAGRDNAVLRAQLRLRQSGLADSGTAASGMLTAAQSNDDVVRLNRRLDVMRRTVEKLAAENRAQATMLADLERLRQESDRRQGPRSPSSLAGY